MNRESLSPRAYLLLSGLWHTRRGLWRLVLALATALLLFLGWRACTGRR